MANANFKLLVSACLLGQPVRYDGKSKPIAELDWLLALKTTGRLVVVCPEVIGGLTTPRAPAEIVDTRVITVKGDDVTAAFKKGAQHALDLCLRHNITHALLKANSPSCGNQQVYDGSFSGELTTGAGVTAQLLQQNGITVYSELQLQTLQATFASMADN